MTSDTRKRGITIFRAADSVDLEETDFMTYPEPVRPSGEGPSPAAEAASGSVIKVLTRDAGGFSLVHAWFKANFPLPRHSHNSDCMYYVISGAAIMGNQTLKAGDSFFVPADAPYHYTAGPEGVEVLEVRHGTEQFDIQVSAGPEAFENLFEAISANREAWAQTPVSPTFAANAS